MKNPINKSNIRRPLKGILLLTILLIASNLFTSSISQFYIVNREIDNIGKYYKSVGSIIPTNDNYDVKEARKLIADDPMIDFEDIRRQTIGVIDGMYKGERNVVGFAHYIGEDSIDFIFIGEISDAYKSRSADNIYQGSILVTKVMNILAGIPNYIESDFTYKDAKEHHFLFSPYSIATGERFEYVNDDVIDELFKLESGKKYLFRTFIEGESKEGSTAKPLYEGGPLYIELDDSGYIDWDDPEFKRIKEDIDFINENIISYDVIGTKDMTGMMEVQDGAKDYYIVEGRWLNNEDNENQNHVVVIPDTLAKMYKINIGDTIDMKMRDSEYGGALY